MSGPTSAVSPDELPMVRGTAFLGVIRHILDTGHPLDQVLAVAPPATRAVFEERIRVLGWYSYEGFAGLLRASDRKLGTGDLGYCVRLGEAASAKDLGSVFAFLAKLASPEWLIRSCGRVWGQYYRNAGRMEAVAWSPASTILRIHDFPRMDPAHCRLMAGWMVQSMRTLGATVHSGVETRCTSTGGAYHEFTARWSM
jgi:hypothetical protein